MSTPHRDRWSSQIISNGAYDYLRAAKKLAPNLLTADNPFWFCVCQSIELSLKSFLRAKKFTKAQLKSREMGHKLGDLLAQAEACGLGTVVTLDSSERDIICHHGNMYGSKAFQYAEAGWSQRAYVKDVMAVAQKLFDATRPVAEAGRTEHHGKQSAVL